MKDDPSGAVPTKHRRLAALMFTDIVGFSRQMGADETRMLRILAVHNQVIEQAVAGHHGQVIKTMGDAFVVDFPSVVHAVQCAQLVQERFRQHNAQTAKEEQIHVRIGIHLGDIIQQNGDVLGDGVNIASRLQTLTEPDTICISQAVYQEVEKKIPLGTVVSLGRPQLKNIMQRFPVYALLSEKPQGIRQRLQVQCLKLSHRVRPAHRLVVAGLLLIVGTLVTVHYLPFPIPNSELVTPNSQPLPLPDKPSIVVLPFVNISGDPEQEYFSDGITEDLTSDLSKISSLFVIARNSAFTYKGKAVKVQDVSRELGVQYVLEGSVRKSGDQVRVTAQLIDATTGGHLWSERYDRELKDIFALQDELRKKIVLALKVQLTPEEQERLRRFPTDNLEAYDSGLRGLEFLFRAVTDANKEANEQARHLFEKALEHDPRYAQAFAWLAGTYFFDWFYLWNPTLQTLQRAGELAQKAIALDDSLPGPHATLGPVYLWQKQHAQAIVEAERAIALDPNWATGYLTLGQILPFVGRPEEAIGMIEKGMRLNPQNPDAALFNLGFALRIAGRYEEAIPPVKKFLALHPDSGVAYFHLAVCYAELNQLEEARTAAAEAMRLNPRFSIESFARNWPMKDPAVVERHIAALRKAGFK